MSKAERIYVKVDVTKINKEWLFKGREKDGKTPMYVDLCLVPSSKFDDQDWFVSQQVPKEVWKADKNIKGPIVGNAKFAERTAKASAPVQEYDSNPPGRPGGPPENGDQVNDDQVPF